MSLMSHVISTNATQRISYSTANDFIKLLDEERSARELLSVLAPGTYQIGSGDGILQWNGQIAYHVPPNGDVETFDYLTTAEIGANARRMPAEGSGGRRNGMGGLLHELGKLQNDRPGCLQSPFEQGAGQKGAEMTSPWSRGWAEAERQERR